MNLKSLDERLPAPEDAFQEEGREARQQLAAVLEASLDAFLMLDGDLRITACNRAVERIFGYPSSEVVGTSVERLVPLMATDGLESPRFNLTGPLRGLRATGERFPVETRIARIQSRGKISYVLTVRDVSERATMLEEIAHLNRAASMGQMAASIAHELAQPLAAILCNAQAAVRFAGKPSLDLDEIRGALSEIIQDDQRASSFLQNMRAMFQRHRISRGALDLNSVLSDVSRILRNRALAKDVQMRLNLSSEPVLVLGESIALQQIILNLANNGIDALQGRPLRQRLLTVTSTVRPASRSGIIQVEDNGCGIPPHHKAKLFTPFFTTKRDGLGLGLAICRTVIESLDGRIRLVERKEPGTLFEVELPLVSPDGSAIRGDHCSGALGGGSV